MRLNEVVFNDAKPVEGYGPGFFRVGGQVHHGALVVLPNGVAPWGGYADTQALLAVADDLDILFVGTGPEIAHIPADFRAAIEGADVGIETMATPTACRTYNVLLSEGRRVGLALLPV